MTNTLEDFGQLIYKSVAGSISYGTNIESSDLDIRGIFIPHRKFLVGLNHVDEFKDKAVDDIEYFSIQKFLSLALEGNPNVVEQLFVKDDHVLYQNEFGAELREMRQEFLTKNAYGRFGAYAFAQMKRLNSKNNGTHHGSHKDLIEKYGYDTKHAMHLVRLFQMGIQILSDRELDTFRPNHEELLSIRQGMYTLEEIKQYAEELNEQLEESMKTSRIPDYPDFNKVNRWLVKTVDKAYGLETTKGLFKGVTFNVLPLEYEMIDKCSILSVSNKLVRRKNESEAMGVVIPYKDWFTGLRKFEKPFKFEKTSIDSLHTVVKKARQSDPKIIDMIYASEKHVLFEHPMALELKEKLATLFTTKSTYYKALHYTVGNIKNMQNWEQLKEKWEKEKLTNKSLTEYPPVPKKTASENAAMMTKYGYDTLTACEIVHTLKMIIELLKTGKVEDSRIHEPELYAIKHRTFPTFNDFNVYVNELLEELEEANKLSVLPDSHNFNELEEWFIDFVERFHAQLD